MSIDLKNEDIYTAGEAARRLGVTTNTLTKWLRTGQLKGIKRGKVWYVPDTAIREYVFRERERTTQASHLAMRYGIPIFITVQFNKNQKDRSTNSPDLGDIAGTDSIPQDASIVIGLQKAPSPYQGVRRKAKMMKSREGEVVEITYHYQFSPVLLEEIPWYMLESNEDQEQQQTVSLEWMI